MCSGNSSMQFFCITTIVYALAFFIPIILAGMGYTTGMVFLLSAPPAVAAVPWVLFISWIADKTRCRAPWIMLQATLGIVGLMIVAYAKNNGARYFGIFMGLAGANSNIPTALAWQANNIRGQSLRMLVSPFFFFTFCLSPMSDKNANLNPRVASAMQVAFGAVGGIYASTTFMEKDAPTYRNGMWAVTGCQFYILIATVLMVLHYRRQNKRADRGEIIIEDMEGFRYTY